MTDGDKSSLKGTMSARTLIIAAPALCLGLLALAGGVQGLASVSRFVEEAEESAAAQFNPRVASPEGTGPKVEIERSQYDFGLIDVGAAEVHAFVVRNVGDAPLELRLGKATCSCTAGELAVNRLLPGASTEVRVSWRPPKPAELFSQGVTILTNDPRRSKVMLMVVGRVVVHLAAEPDSISLAETRLGETACRSALLYSQVWDRCQVIDIATSHPALVATIEDAAADELSAAGARSGLRLTASLRPGLPLGDFSGSVHLRVAAAAEDGTSGEPREIELAVQARIVGDVTLMGAGVDRERTLHWGTLRQGRPAQRLVAMLIHGEHRELTIEQIETHPAWLQAEVSASKAIGQAARQYKIRLQIPADAPAIDCLGERAGWVRLRTDHPQEPEVRLSVQFAIAAECR